MEFWIVVYFWITLSVVAGILAAAKRRSGFGYFCIAFCFSPLIGLILAAGLPALPAPAPEPPASNDTASTP